MFIGNFTASGVTTLQVERKSQVFMLNASGLSASEVGNLLGANALIEVWNNKGKIIPPMKLSQLLALNGDEFSIQMGFKQGSGTTGGTYTLVMPFEICDEGSLEKTIYVKFTNPINKAVGLSAVDVTGTTAVKIRNYNFMNIVSPVQLPKNSVCIMPRSSILTLQKGTDVMSDAEILVHSNRIIRDGVLNEIHPVLHDAGLTTPAFVANAVYQNVAIAYAMGYGNPASADVVICTGDDDFTLYPNQSCAVVYCQKLLTKIAQQVNDALVVAGMRNNVDSSEFASAVASVGNEAERQGLTTDRTQLLANLVVNELPSVKLCRVAGVRNLNLTTQSLPTGIAKVVKGA